MPLDPVSTLHPSTGAIRPVTPALLAETYLCPLPAPFEDAAAIREARRVPWSDSLAAAPEATVQAVVQGLHDLIRAAPALDPASIDVEHLPGGRARTHLSALRDLWRDIGGMPENLAPLAHALTCDASAALEPLQLLASANPIGATSADLQLMQLLDHHHGSVERSDAFPGETPAGSSSALQAFQRGERIRRPYPLRVTTVRDPQEELRFAAARAQRLLDEGSVTSAEEIGLLMPDDSMWHLDAEAVFADLGLHLGGLPGPASRDRAAEAVHLILTVLNKPAPGMAMVALDALGFGRDDDLRRLLGRAPRTHADLSRTLHAIAAQMPAALADALRMQAIRTDETPVDWDGLIAMTRPGSLADAPTSATKDAISVFTEGTTPWREVRHLLAIGFAGDRFPSVSGSSPLWLEQEIDLIAQHCGIDLPGRNRSLQMAYARLNRQLSAATDGIEVTLPSRDRAGDRLAPAAALDMLAHRLGRTADDLIAPLGDDPMGWPCNHHTVACIPDTDRPAPPAAQIIELERDLTGLRVTEDGEVRPQSPSRLETLLVSPLAWLLSELGIEDRGWSPDALDVMVRGSVMHKVLEALFPPGQSPAPDAVAEAVPGAIDDAIGSDRELRFLSAPSWAVERAHLIGDLTRAARRWAEVLRETETTIHATEAWLTGTAFGLPLHGKADVVLRLKDGDLLVVDYKSGASKKRIKRMENGWDMQARLYGDMLAGTEIATGANAISVGYLNLADMVAVTDNTRAPAAFGPLDGDSSVEARAQMTQIIADLRKGTLRLNGTGDAKAFDSIGVAAYALDHPLVSAFLWEDEE